MTRWILLGETDEQGSWLGSLDNENAELERARSFTSEYDEPSGTELSEALEGLDGEWILLPLDAGRVVRSKTTTTIDVHVERTGLYT